MLKFLALLFFVVLSQPILATVPLVFNALPKATDAADANQAVMDFLRWYKANSSSTNKIILVNQSPGKNYSVNTKNTELYLTALKSSHLLTETYLNEWRIFFKERQAGFRATPQNEGPPTGFDYDLVMLTQDVDMVMNSLKKLKINSTKINKNRASVKFLLLEEYEFQLVKQNNHWLINEILNLSAE